VLLVYRTSETRVGTDSRKPFQPYIYDAVEEPPTGGFASKYTE
jgi:hypothetical protein